MATILFNYSSDSGVPNSVNGLKGYGATGELLPGRGEGHVDVVRNYPWTLSPPASPALDEVPYIQLTEHRYDQKQLDAQLYIYAAGWKQKTDIINGTARSDPYENLYNPNRTGFTYTIPYFDDTAHSIDSSWDGLNALDISGLTDVSGGLIQFAGEERIRSKKLNTGGLAVLAGGLIKSLPGIVQQSTTIGAAYSNSQIGIVDRPKLFSRSSERSFTIEFPLYNTITTSGQRWSATIQKNWELCYLLTYQNLFYKKSFFTASPPVFYDVYIPGLYHTKAAVVSRLKITNKGNIRRMTFDWTGRMLDYNIPDCYVVSITLQDLLTPSKNLMHSAGSGPVTTTSAAFNSNLNTTTLIQAAASVPADAAAAVSKYVNQK
jgi:hypothetical protein